MWRRLTALVALPHFLCAAAAIADITSASLEIQGAGLRLETVSVTTGLDIPTTIQTSFGNRTNDQAPSVPGLLAVGDLTGPGIEIPIQLTTTPGYRFHIPGLTRLGDYYLQNVRLMNGSDVIQRATPSLAKITVADLFQTSLAVKQLTPEEIRARGIVIDERNYDVYVKDDGRVEKAAEEALRKSGWDLAITWVQLAIHRGPGGPIDGRCVEVWCVKLFDIQPEVRHCYSMHDKDPRAEMVIKIAASFESLRDVTSN